VTAKPKRMTTTETPVTETPKRVAVDASIKDAVFGHWTATGLGGKTRHGQRLVKVRCDCGTKRSVLASALRDGSSKSCGGAVHRAQRNVWVVR